MRRRTKITAVSACIGLACLAYSHRSSRATDLQNFSQIEKGRYLTIAADCAACHTQPGGQYLAGGRSIETPFGNMVAANITPDPETGLGGWTSDEFRAALKRGIGRGGTYLYPAMPYVYYSKMTDQDIDDIWAYLSTIKPVRNPVISNQLPFPFNIRASLYFWNLLFRPQPGWTPTAGKSAEWNRGAYLVEGPMHCGACHTPKNFLGGDTSAKYQGFSLQGWHAPNITNDAKLGLGSWSVEDIAQYLKNGHNKVASAAGPMSEEVERSSSMISDGDLKAIAIYLKDQNGAESAPPPQALDASDPVMKAGSAIYRDQCSACHKLDGSGVSDMFPALRAAPTVRAKDPTSLIRVVIDGTKSAATPGAPTGPGMPSYAWQLNDQQIAAVLTFVRNSWGNAAEPVSEGAVRSARSALVAGND